MSDARTDALTDDIDDSIGRPTDPAESQDALTQAEEIIRNASEADDPETEALIPETLSAKAPKASKKTRSTRKTTTASTVDVLTETVASLARVIESLNEKVDAASDRSSRDTTRSPRKSTIPTSSNDVYAASTGTQAGLRDVTVNLLRVLAYAISVGLVATAAGMEKAGTSMLLFAVVGIVAFAVASASESDSTPRTLTSLARKAGSAALIAVGLGLIVGGLQHFGDVPQRAAKMIPVGAAVFATGFFLRRRYRLASEQLVWVAGAGIWVCLLLTLGLGQIATSMQGGSTTTPDEPASPIAHTDGATTDDHGPSAAATAGNDHGATTTSSDTHATSSDTHTTSSDAHATSSNNKNGHAKTSTGH